MARHQTTALALLLVVAVASPVTAQDESAPPLETELTPDSELAMGVQELGGAWRKMAAAPFGAVDVPGGWTGTELVIVDPDEKRRATSYLPALDAWSNVAKPPHKLLTGSDTYWTGSELLFVEPRGTAKRGLTLYDPVTDEWRATAPAPFNEIASSAWADGRLVAAAASGFRTATYDLETDAWLELSSLPDEVSTELPLRLHTTGDDVLAFVAMTDEAALAFVPLDLETGEWGEPSVGPLTEGSAEPLWTGSTFISMAAPPLSPLGETSLPVDATFDPLAGEWVEVENACGIDTSNAFWAEPLVLDVDRQVGLDPETGACFTLPESPWVERTGALRLWTGNEVLEVSGDTGGEKPRRDGLAYDPYPGDDSLGVALDKGSRPVRVQVPSLGIDLPVVWDGRKVPGSSRGYPACDVALTWSIFDLPGKPGTAWVLAHAQPGMFLPLLQAVQANGKQGLLGREIELQLRDRRVLTYRINRVNSRATNTNIGTKGRKSGEHRLVLQTSTGIGSAPKLLVAARLVDVGTTDERRPKPNPRACG